MDADHERVAGLLNVLNARAAGLWRVEPTELVQRAFVCCADMPEAVARGFAQATRRVPLHQRALGIVTAAVARAVTVSRVAELPAEIGSGYWLRAFGAARSVAVPVLNQDQELQAIVSVALAHETPPADRVAEVIQAHFGTPAQPSA